MATLWGSSFDDRRRGGSDYHNGYGGNPSSNISLKLIGGRQVPVVERHPVIPPPQYFGGSRIQPIKPIAEKPNHMDPRLIVDDPGLYYQKDMQSPAYFKRPDSKDVVRGQLRNVPDIHKNRTRNDMSTVFEAEPWTGNVHPPLAHDTEYTQNYFPGMNDERDMEVYRQTSGGNFVSEFDKHQLLSLIPRNVMLPVDSIRLTLDQELTLYKLICNDLHRFNPKELRNVYVECSQWDQNLEGYCSLEVLDRNLQKHRAYLPDILRVISAQFVHPRRPGYVNYERVLSFIGYALDLSKNGQLFKTGSMYQDREVAKLLRTVEQELSHNTYTLDWRKWQTAFEKEDREHKGTLTSAQIKDVCCEKYLPLQDSIINKILLFCDNRTRDGQYRWHDFLSFLKRIRPTNTGYQTPKSNESPLKPLPPPVKEKTAEERKAEEEWEANKRKHREERAKRDAPRLPRDEQLKNLTYQIHDLEKKYQLTKDGIVASDKPWSDRFILMAQALYNTDTSNKGSLPRNEVMDIVREYNSALALDLDMGHIDMLTIAPENLDKSGNIILRAFLNRISTNSQIR